MEGENMIEKEMQFRFKDIFEMEHPEIILKRAQPFIELMMEYQCALMEVETKLNVLNEEFASKYKRNPFESIKSRIKEPLSIINKMKRKGFEMSVESMEKNLFDIAGIRVICSFCDDIYTIAELLTRQDDIILVETKDYIKNPKANGYRSLHLILDIPIFLSTGKKHMKVEVQFRTIAMDFWASLEHKLKYKKDIEHSEEIAEELKDCADVIATMDCKMQEIRNKIEGNL
ncbi:GTP pyrophosphokinase family protein [Anaerotignum lactatifermentans]|uniref:GTP pyrophosphokinase family protein n=2 Tax=Anaerotignum lactatifermentans TaxID=160404 RepID=A0ABS2G6J0_9FIRM|nr:GTP pyrophosphokinase family protein [Anaerotignum lactatifermentans]MBM6877076.1 GTP pyrophosphokinase family protein [Anaerotignum lactatifermentans]MBM6950331.1 GTP pyrophosphokinase family protein [Anaerotignum lactatifermentans]